MAEVIFNFGGNKTKIQCDISDKMETIIQRFLIKAQKQLSNLKLVYLYSGSCIKNELSFSEQANDLDKERKIMNILVTNEEDEDKIETISLQDIACPICMENILIEIKNFKINLYDCKNKHKIENILLTEFEASQKIDLSKIICDICKSANKCNSYNNEFFICNKCNKNICPLCKLKHDPEHTIINYDDKNYLCQKHNDPFTKFCKDCFENICIICESKHNGHNLFDLGKIIVDKNELLKVNENLKNIIDEIKLKVKRKYLLDKIENRLNLYYKINKDYISNYNINKRNFHKLQNLNYLKNHNEKLVDDFNKIYNGNMEEIYDFIFINFYNPFDNMKNNLNEENNLFKKSEKKENYYDIIILGTGLKEEALACLLSKNPKKILGEEKNEEVKIYQLDRNDYLGSDVASLNLKNLSKYFKKEVENVAVRKDLDWHVSLIPKFILANGSLVKIILKSDVGPFMDWKGIDGEFIYHFSKGGFFSKAKGGIYQVSKDFTTNIMGKSEKNKFKKFLNDIEDYEVYDSRTPNNLFKDFYSKYSLDSSTLKLEISINMVVNFQIN